MLHRNLEPLTILIIKWILLAYYSFIFLALTLDANLVLTLLNSREFSWQELIYILEKSIIETEKLDGSKVTKEIIDRIKQNYLQFKSSIRESKPFVIDPSLIQKKILSSHRCVEEDLNSIASSSPNGFTDEWWQDHDAQRTIFDTLSSITRIPVKADLYWEAREHFICKLTPKNKKIERRYRATIERVKRWLESIEKGEFIVE